MKHFVSFLIGTLIVGALNLGAQNIYLVSAGIADYPGKQNDLVCPARDAQAIYQLYLKNSKATAILLTDGNATKSQILTKARNVFDKAKEKDIVVLFFSGHGTKGGFVTYDGLVSYDEIRRLFASCKASNKMIFADACFSGDIREGGHSGFNDPQNNIMLFLSSRSNEVSIERRSMKNGFFTTCLVRSLKGGADTNRDRVITAKELFTAVSKGVKDLSKDRQHPVMWGNFKDTMPVMAW